MTLAWPPRPGTAEPGEVSTAQDTHLLAGGGWGGGAAAGGRSVSGEGITALRSHLHHRGDGSEVNFNIYPSKDAVYLDGAPGPGAPQTGAGLDDGAYVFQVTARRANGLAITHTDPLGVTDVKWSYWAPSLQIFHEAHVEDVEPGTHYITVDNQPGCPVGHVLLNGSTLPRTGPQTVAVTVQNNEKADTLRVDVECV